MKYIIQHLFISYLAILFIFFTCLHLLCKKYPQIYTWINFLPATECVLSSPFLYFGLMSKYKSFALDKYFKNKNDLYFFLNKIAFPLLMNKNKTSESRYYPLEIISLLFQRWTNLMQQLNELKGDKNSNINNSLNDCLKESSYKATSLNAVEFNHAIVVDTKFGLIKIAESSFDEIDFNSINHDKLIKSLKILKSEMILINKKSLPEKILAKFYSKLIKIINTKINQERLIQIQVPKRSSKHVEENSNKTLEDYIHSEKLNRVDLIKSKVFELAKANDNTNFYILLYLLEKRNCFNSDWQITFTDNLAKKIRFFNKIAAGNLNYKCMDAFKNRNNKDISANRKFPNIEKFVHMVCEKV